MRKLLIAAALFCGLCGVTNSANAQGQPKMLPGQLPAQFPQQQVIAQPVVVHQPMNYGPPRVGFFDRLLSPVFGPGPGTPGGGMQPLPMGRRYLDGRYFGPLNDRYYGPQYGNF